jgi:hypothetical protein
MHPLIILYLVGVLVLLSMLAVGVRMRSDYIAQKEAQHGTALFWSSMLVFCFASWPMLVYLVVSALRER